VNISFLTEKLPYSQICGTKLGPSYEKTASLALIKIIIETTKIVNVILVRIDYSKHFDNLAVAYHTIVSVRQKAKVEKKKSENIYNFDVRKL